MWLDLVLKISQTENIYSMLVSSGFIHSYTRNSDNSTIASPKHVQRALYKYSHFIERENELICPVSSLADGSCDLWGISYELF